MNYITLKQAAEATGLTETTIRRLCKKAESKPFIKLQKGKSGSIYTIQTNYLFDKYPPVQSPKKEPESNLYKPIHDEHRQPTQDYTALWEAKDETIRILKEELVYLKEENRSLREENRDLKLLPAHKEDSEPKNLERKSIWKRIFG
jgi:predicted transcriptional regulator